MRATGPAPLNGDRYLDLDGARLRYRVEGAGPAVVLMHGWTLDLEQWDFQVAILASRYRVVRFDRRGFGLSSGQASLAADVADASALCRHLGVARAAFVGMSQAARAVVLLAAAHPASVTCVVLDGAPASVAACGRALAPDVPLDPYRVLLRQAGVEAFRRSWSDHPMMRLARADPAAQELLARMIARYRGEDLLDPPAAADGALIAPALDAIHVPALVLFGELDVSSRRQGASLIARELAQGHLEAVPGAGHLANLDDPAAYNDILLRFLDRHAAA